MSGRFRLKVTSAILFLSLASASCAKPAKTTAAAKAPGPSSNVIPIQPLHDRILGGRSTEIRQVLSLGASGYAALAVSYEGEGEPERARLKIFHVDNHGRSHLYPLKGGDDRHLVSLGENRVAFAVDRPELDAAGRLSSEVELRELDLGNGAERVMWGSHVVYDAGFGKSGVLSASELQEVRQGRRELYESYVLTGSPLMSPPVFFPESGLVFLDKVFESALAGPREAHPLQPLLRNPRSGLYHLRWLRPVKGSRARFATIATPAELHDLFPKAADVADEASQLVLLESADNEPRLIALRTSGASLWAAAAAGEREVFVGGAREGEQQRIWVASRFAGELKERVLRLPQSATAHRVDVDPRSGAIVIGGICEYTQARTGSLSHTSGFVLQLDADLEVRDWKVLRGKRSTRVGDVVFDNRRVLVGGYTDGPDTHSENRGRRAFLIGVARP